MLFKARIWIGTLAALQVLAQVPATQGDAMGNLLGGAATAQAGESTPRLTVPPVLPKSTEETPSSSRTPNTREWIGKSGWPKPRTRDP